MSLAADLIACLGEFVGTFLFLFLGEGGAKTASVSHFVSTISPDERPTSLGSETVMFVSLSFGLSLAVTCWMFFRISGGLFNPAITFALYLVGAVPVRRASMLVVAQLLGGIAAAAMVEVLTPFKGTASVVKLEKGVTVVQGLFLEAILTGALVFSVLMLAAEKHKSTHMAPLGIGLTLFVCHLFGVLWTGSSLNNARALGPSVVERTFPHYHWIYHAGPLIGSLMAVGFYIALKSFDYTRAVLGQDADHYEGEAPSSVPVRLIGRARSLSAARRGGLEIGGTSSGGKPIVVLSPANKVGTSEKVTSFRIRGFGGLGSRRSEADPFDARRASSVNLANVDVEKAVDDQYHQQEVILVGGVVQTLDQLVANQDLSRIRSNRSVHSEHTAYADGVGMERREEGGKVDTGSDKGGEGLEEEEQHHQQTYVVGVALGSPQSATQQQGGGGGSTMRSEGQDVGGILAPGTTNGGLMAASKILRDAVSS
ncbi:aquaporin-like protein [Violaceomyces palustris]|uniref:Aquaporin-like protein n=1 Tax=Violaceomyces palustris TaxID=1673888 RepID=A0ACD0NW98_9BASI|nr:aquaporin-like protein [Violaceomyces palustris]